MQSFLETVWNQSRGMHADPLGLAYGELRFMKTDPSGAKIVEQFFCDMSLSHEFGIKQAVEEAMRYVSNGWDVYYGVLLRNSMKGTAAACPDWTSILWADIDGKNFANKGAALAALNLYPIRPSIVVDSGNGFHAYWLLDNPLPKGEAQLAMKEIARICGGDAVSDFPRILRLPDTRNYKKPPYPPVRLLRLDRAQLYRPTDFVVPEKKTTRKREILNDGDLTKIPVWLSELIKDGAPRGQRSETSFKVCLWLLRYGINEGQIRDLFADHSSGIGEKYSESGDRWLTRTIGAAREAL